MMDQMYGGSLNERSSSSYRTSLALALELLLLSALGMGAVALHAMFRSPLQLPGHHGVEWMALIIAGRAASRRRWAATWSSLSAAAFAALPVWGFGDPFQPLVYFLPGVVIDALSLAGGRWRGSILFLAAAASLGHATKPLARWIISMSSGWPYGSLMYGVLYPLATHLGFGLLGGLLGAGVMRVARKKQ